MKYSFYMLVKGCNRGIYNSDINFKAIDRNGDVFLNAY